MTLPYSASRRFVSSIPYHLKTVFLFTKSDITTTIIPVTSLAVTSAPLASAKNLAHVVFWVWLHLLQLDVSNQTLDPEEDKHNKKDRPLPSGRITLEKALILRWLLVPACIALSMCYSFEIVYASIVLCMLTYIYNEMGFAAGHWFGRIFVTALGLVSFDIGACLIAGSNRHSLDSICVLSVLCSAGIICTTVQAEEFKDTEGDILVGRKTLAIVAPKASRLALAFALSVESVGLSYFWKLSMEAAVIFNLLALVVGLRFMAFNSNKADQRSNYLYNVWLFIAFSLPVYSRFVTIS